LTFGKGILTGNRFQPALMLKLLLLNKFNPWNIGMPEVIANATKGKISSQRGMVVFLKFFDIYSQVFHM